MQKSIEKKKCKYEIQFLLKFNNQLYLAFLN